MKRSTMDDSCPAATHNFQAHAPSGRIFCTKCGEFRGGTDMHVGIIAMWSGSLEHLANGWVLCDGTKGTPDLRDKFIVGAGGGYSMASTGGSIHHKLIADNLPEHWHPRNVGGTSERPLVETVFPRSNNNNVTVHHKVKLQSEQLNFYYNDQAKTVVHGPTNHTTTGPSGKKDPTPIDVRPPYYALAFVMRK